MNSKKSGKKVRKVSPPTSPPATSPPAPSTPATSPPATSPPAPSTPATSPPAPSTSATSPPAPSMPGTSNSAEQAEFFINIDDENGEVMEQVEDDHEESDDDDDDDEDPPPTNSGVEQPQPPQRRKRRRKSTNIILTEETERMLGEWLEFEAPCLYDKGDPRHKQKEHIDHVVAEKAASMEPPITALDLMTWFTSLRSRFGRLTKLKSGDGAKRLTEREKWIIDMFRFLKPHIVLQKKPRTLGMPQSAAQAAEPASVPVPDPAPAPPTDDVEDPSAGSQEDTTPAISMPARKAKQGKPPGAVPSTASTSHGTLEQVLATAEKVRHNLAGVMDVVEDPELQYWRASLDVMAKDCVGLPAGFNTPLKIELMAALNRFRTAHEEGVTKPGQDLMLHATRNYGFQAPQPQPQAQQHQPATTVMYQGNPPTTLPQPMPTQPKPATFVLPPHVLQSLLRPQQSATPPGTFLPPNASTPTHSQLVDLSNLGSQFGNTSFNLDHLLSGSPGYNPGTPAQSVDPDQTLETPKKPP